MALFFRFSLYFSLLSGKMAQRLVLGALRPQPPSPRTGSNFRFPKPGPDIRGLVAAYFSEKHIEKLFGPPKLGVGTASLRAAKAHFRDCLETDSETSLKWAEQG